MHHIHYSSYNENVDKAEVQEEWDEYAAMKDEKEGCSGLDKPIRWIDKILPNLEAAEEYIRNHDSGWYNQLAVKYRADVPGLTSKTQEILQERAGRLRARANELSSNIHYKGVKSAFITCRNCGSKLASGYFGKSIVNNCPVCRSDLRPQSTLDLIAKAEANAKKAEKDLAVENAKLQKKAADKAEIQWLVKIEYHT
jgi:hypothetical protein